MEAEILVPYGGDCHWPVSCNIIYVLSLSLFSVMHLMIQLQKGCSVTVVVVLVVKQTFGPLKFRLWINFFFLKKALSSLQRIMCGDELREDQKQMEIMIEYGKEEKEKWRQL